MPLYGPPSSGSVATDTIWDTKGDIVAATAADTAAKVVIGTDGWVLTADAASTPGLKWAAAAGGAPTGTAGGDLASTYPNPTIKASVGLTGTPTAPTAAVDTNTTQIASTAMVLAQAASATPLGSTTTAVVGTSTRYARADHVHPTGGLLGPPVVVARTTDGTAVNNSTVLVADSQLLFAVSGNSTDVFLFEMFLLVNTGAGGAAADVKIGWTVPSGTTMKWGMGFIAGSTGNPGSAATTTLTFAPTTVFGAGSTGSYPMGTSNDNFVRAEGFIYVGGSSGNVNLTMAQVVADASNTLIKAGSLLRLTRLV